jgi:two-component sensor histidine kinase
MSMTDGRETQTPENQRPRKPLIVGVGASASARDSVERFFSRLSLGTDQAVVLVMQHREALDEVWLRAQIEPLDGVRLTEAGDGAEIEGKTIYLCPANMITTLLGDRFAVREAEHAPGERATIDSFLVSLAEDRAEQSIGVILAGTGGDGTLGVATLKDHGGLAIAEGNAEESNDHLVDSNAAAALADFVLAPEDIPEHVEVYARHLRRLEEKQGFDDVVAAASASLVRSEHVERLESELRATRERLQATIEELESTNEELKSSNEEYQSLNEKLQTSREELQSVNEELATVNGELAHRVQELTRATSDLKNFLESTQIATVFLDNDMRVMNFTPAITQVLPLVETDVGRPISHIKAKIPIEELCEDIRKVLRTLVSAERELTAPDSGTRHIVRILPYRSIDNFIAGVVMTFVDVTAIARAEQRQRLLFAELQHRARNALSVVRSIARRSAQTSSTVEEYAFHLDGRLNAFARTQALVTRDPESGVDLEYLVAEELMVYNARDGEQVRLSGPAVRLQPKPAETFALAIHELATNAVKYGALSQPAGHVEIAWRIEPASPTELVFEWREMDGPEVNTPQRQGFGTEMLERTLAFEFQARTSLVYNRTGVQCTIRIPVTRRIFQMPVMDS